MLDRRVFTSALLGLPAALAGCHETPGSGPATLEIRTGDPQSTADIPYAIVTLNARTIDTLAAYAPRFAGYFSDSRPPRQIRFGIGDIVGVTIFEASAGGLFIPTEAGVRPGNFISLPNQAVDSRGNISVPYAGSVRALGRSPTEVSAEIVSRINQRAIEPQAVVTLIEQRTSMISVLGEVNAPARFPASAAGERLLDAITRAGGPKGQGFDTWVMLERGGRRATVPFGALVYEPRNNIHVHPEDTLYVYREPQTVLVFGAAGLQGQFNFDAWRISLAEAVGKAGGMNDSLADPGAVFVYRGESRLIAKELGVNVEPHSGLVVPIVYDVNLRDPAGYFLATKFQMRNKDVVYISNAPFVERAKVLQYIRLVTATVNDPVVAATNAVVLRNTIKLSP